jgi:hypothetical protein
MATDPDDIEFGVERSTTRTHGWVAYVRYVDGGGRTIDVCGTEEEAWDAAARYRERTTTR